MDFYLLIIIFLLAIVAWLIYSLYKEWKDDPFKHK